MSSNQFTPAPPPSSSGRGGEAAKVPAPPATKGAKASGSEPTSPASPATAAVSANPRVKSHQEKPHSGGAVTTTSGNESAGVALPRGGAVAAAQQIRNNPTGMHDVDFYQAVAEELPHSKVIHSILYTHRSVMDEGLTVEEEMSAIKTGAHEWETHKSKEVKEIQDMKKQYLTEAKEEEDKEEKVRLLEHSRVFARCDEIAANLDISIEATLVAEDQALKVERHEMENQKRKRKLALDQRLLEQQEEDLQTKMQHSNLEAFAGLARTEMEELMTRGLNKTKEERARLSVAFIRADEAQRIGVFLERREWEEKLVLTEQRERSHIQTWIEDTNTRARRQHRLGQLVLAMTSNVCLSEQGERQNLSSGQAVEMMALEAEWLSVSPKRGRDHLTATTNSAFAGDEVTCDEDPSSAKHSVLSRTNLEAQQQQKGEGEAQEEDQLQMAQSAALSTTSTPALDNAASPPNSPHSPK